MMLFSNLLRRAKRVLLCLKRSAVKALALETVLFTLFICCMLIFTDSSSFRYTEALELSVILLIFTWTVFFIQDLVKYSFNIFHRYDEDVIGTCFSGLDKKSALFEQGVEFFHKCEFKAALEVFTELDTGKYKISEDEQAVLSFYRGRCYNILGVYPNAVLCYEKALDGGFSLPVLPLFTARCLYENGDTARAMKIYTGLLDPQYQHSDIVRTEIGKMYLKLNDGETALKWFQESIDRRENYADALGGAAIAHTMLHHFKEGEELYRAAIINRINDPDGYAHYFKEVQAAALLETHV